jgi:thioredoxin-like negative regulator of GroEL
MPEGNRRTLALALAAAGTACATSVHAEALTPAAAVTDVAGSATAAAPVAAAANCQDGTCSYRFTAEQLLGIASKLVSDKKFEEARPLVAALQAAPGMAVPYNFLEGMIALETGDAKTAAERFRAILKDHPGETRVRLELAKALLAQNKLGDADYHLRLAQNDENLPEDIGRAVSNARSIIRSKRNWKFGFDAGIAPDTNINSATSAETVDLNFSPTMRIPITLDEEARARSGTGITASTFGSIRLPLSQSTAIVADLDANMVNYKGKQSDDYSTQLAIGPEWRLGSRTNIALQGVGLYRWYGGNLAARQFGAKLNVQHDLSTTQRVAVQFDGRNTDSAFGAGFRGWQLGVAGTYEQVVAKSAIVSANLFARRDMMELKSFASKTIGFNLGIGGELPLGINAGVFGGASRSIYDEAQPAFAPDPTAPEARKDWRYQARLYLGLRHIRVMGFSPSIEYNYSQVSTNYAYYQSNRHRVQFKIARYF